MKIIIKEDPAVLGKTAGQLAAERIRQVIAEKGQVNIILATGASQLKTLDELVRVPGVDWGKVVMFHLDEYIGLSRKHPASFSRYIQDRFLAQLPPLKEAFLIDGEADPEAECLRLNALIKTYPTDLALVGIGENGHLAFNDPPADFHTLTPYLVVNLDLPCREQQLAEGWFSSLDEIPDEAISMSVQQILSAACIICSVPGERKAVAVSRCLEGPVTNLSPASILQTHGNCYCFLDASSARLLNPINHP